VGEDKTGGASSGPLISVSFPVKKKGKMPLNCRQRAARRSRKREHCPISNGEGNEHAGEGKTVHMGGQDLPWGNYIQTADPERKDGTTPRRAGKTSFGRGGAVISKGPGWIPEALLPQEYSSGGG